MGVFSSLPDNHWVEVFFLLILIVVSAPLLGAWLSRFFSSRFGKTESLIYRFLGIRPEAEMNWKSYLWNLILFNFFGLVFLVGILMLQGRLPFNPDQRTGLDFGLALNIAVSFVTNTNWQAYAGEEVISHFSEMLGLGVQNFLSAATGIAVMVCLARCLTRKMSPTVGNVWVDLTRAVAYVLLPLSFIFSLFYIMEGTPQNFSPKVQATTLESKVQTIPQGPVASRLSIKMLGSNGGGFYNANSAHPYENPTPLTNFVSIFLMLLIPGACLFLYGRIVKDRAHSWALFGAVLAIFVPLTLLSIGSQLGLNHSIYDHSFVEGIETRFGPSSSALWQAVTTATSNGSVNSQVSSLAPLVGFVNLFLMLSGEIIFGGVGSGVYGLVLFSILAVFLAGLMVGRTPEYLGKKIQAPEIVWASIGVLAPGMLVLLFTGIAAVLPSALSALKHGGPHGLSEMLYAFASAAENNGSAFAGLNAAHPFYLWTTTFAMLAGRFAVIVPTLALAGHFAEKKLTPPSSGTFPTNGVMFSIILIGVIVVVGALTFFPALALGPILEHLLMLQGRVFVP